MGDKRRRTKETRRLTAYATRRNEREARRALRKLGQELRGTTIIALNGRKIRFEKGIEQ